MKKIATLQSNYIPWKHYFKMIAGGDDFIVNHDCIVTKY